MPRVRDVLPPRSRLHGQKQSTLGTVERSGCRRVSGCGGDPGEARAWGFASVCIVCAASQISPTPCPPPLPDRSPANPSVARRLACSHHGFKLGLPLQLSPFSSDIYPPRVSRSASRSIVWTPRQLHPTMAEPGVEDVGWQDVVSRFKTGPDHEHEVVCSAPETKLTHVKLVMIPDGGIKRLRAFGTRV